jgi:hypothetical protein
MSGFSLSKFQFLTSTGSPNAYGTINVYLTGTTTYATIYYDSALTSAAPNPFTLDANGVGKFYISSSSNLRIDSYTGTSAFIETIDPVYPIGTSSSSSSIVVYNSGSLTLSTTNVNNNIVSTSPFTLTLPVTTGFSSSFQVQLNAQGGAITLTPYSTDKINGGAAGASYVIPANASAELWTDAAGNWGFNFLNNVTTITASQGRLTLSTGTPVMNTDVVGSVIYYTPYIGNYVPIWNGSNFVNTSFSELTLTLNSTYHPTTKVYDVYASLQSGVVTLSALYWGGTNARSTSAGGYAGTANASIIQKNGIWVNNAAIATGQSYNNSTSYVIAQYQGTWLGTFYTTGAGQTQVNFKPSSVSGGCNNIVGIWNAYNRIPIRSISRDSNNTWTYATSTWRSADASTSNRVSYVDGAQQSQVKTTYSVLGTTATLDAYVTIGVSLNSTTASPNVVSINYTPRANNGTTMVATETFLPQLGFNYYQAMEISNSAVTATFTGNGVQALILEAEY